MSAREKLPNIVEYWNKNGIITSESSTSEGDPQLAAFDNLVENNVLVHLLNEQVSDHNGSALDIGAGKGRFIPTIKKFSRNITLLEPAGQLFDYLIEAYSDDPDITIKNETFEGFNSEDEFSLILVSGVLYLYDDKMVVSFLSKLIGNLKENGVIIIRDFIHQPNSVSYLSSYVDGAKVSYRCKKYWVDAAQSCGLKYVDIIPSRLRLRFLRSRISRILNRIIPIYRILGLQKVKDTLGLSMVRTLDQNGLNCCFIILKNKS